MKIARVMMALATPVVFLTFAQHTGSFASTTVPTTWQQIGPPLHPARMTQDQAIAAARAAGWSPGLANSKATTLRYGRYLGPMTLQDAAFTHSMANVWAITISGLNDPAGRPLMPESVPTAQPYHDITFLVDDQTGRVLLAREDR